MALLENSVLLFLLLSSLKNTLLPYGGCNEAPCTHACAQQAVLLSCCLGSAGQIPDTETSEDNEFAARMIFGVRKYDDVTPFLKKLNWLALENMFNAATVCFMYKVAIIRCQILLLPCSLECVRSVRELLTSQMTSVFQWLSQHLEGGHWLIGASSCGTASLMTWRSPESSQSLKIKAIHVVPPIA